LPTCLTRMTKSNKALSYRLTKLEVKRAYYVIVRCYLYADYEEEFLSPTLDASFFLRDEIEYRQNDSNTIKCVPFETPQGGSNLYLLFSLVLFGRINLNSIIYQVKLTLLFDSLSLHLSGMKSSIGKTLAILSSACLLRHLKAEVTSICYSAWFCLVVLI